LQFNGEGVEGVNEEIERRLGVLRETRYTTEEAEEVGGLFGLEGLKEATPGLAGLGRALASTFVISVVGGVVENEVSEPETGVSQYGGGDFGCAGPVLHGEGDAAWSGPGFKTSNFKLQIPEKLQHSSFNIERSPGLRRWEDFERARMVAKVRTDTGHVTLDHRSSVNIIGNPPGLLWIINPLVRPWVHCVEAHADTNVRALGR
jgi:hypothetical protein